MVKKSFFIVVALVFLPLTMLRAGSQPERTLSLKECISIALGNASSVKKAANAQKLEGIDLLRSYGSFLPKVTSSASWVPASLNRSYNATSPLYGGTSSSAYRIRTESSTLDFTLTTTLNLFNGLSDYAALQKALDLKRASDFTLLRARETVVYDVTQWYYQVQLNKELLGIAQENLNSARDLLSLTDRQFNIGLKSITDLYQQQAEVSTNELSVINAENQLRRSKLELLRRLRIDPETEITLEAVDTDAIARLPQEPDLQVLVTSGLKNRADLQASTLESDAAEREVRRVSGNRLPKLDMALSMSTDAIASSRISYKGNSIDYAYPSVSRQLDNGMDYTVSLNLSWSIFDGFLTRYNVETAKAARMNKQLDEEDLRDNIIIDLKQAAGDYRAAFTRIDSASKSLKAATSAYDGVRRKYELGASGFVELSTARAALYSARSSVTQAIYNLALQKALLDFTSGNTIIE